VRSLAALICIAALSLAGCGGDDDDAAPPATSTSVGGPSGTVASTVAPSTTVTTLVFPTTSLPCQTLPAPKTPVTSPKVTTSVNLTKVAHETDGCVDHVRFELTSKTASPPGYSVTYGTPPFTTDGSGETVAVQGSAFITVTMQPAYGYDFENGTPTYTGPKRIAPTGAQHVTEIVETGDFEGVLNWVIGLDAKRPFSVQATGDPTQLVVSIG
jgi:hypothetical protein